MAKDSQPDNKYARLFKSNFDTPITRETAKNHNRTSKKQSNRKEVNRHNNRNQLTKGFKANPSNSLIIYLEIIVKICKYP